MVLSLLKIESFMSNVFQIMIVNYTKLLELPCNYYKDC